MKHFNLQYVWGFNELVKPYTMSEKNSGIHFCLRNDIPKWLNTMGEIHTICEVHLCEDSIVIPKKSSLRTNKCYLKNPEPYEDFIYKNYDIYYLLQIHPFNIQYTVPEQTYLYNLLQDDENSHSSIIMRRKKLKEYILPLIYAFPFCAGYTIDVTIKELLPIVQQNGLDIRHLRHQPPDICLAAVRQNGLALGYVKYKLLNICVEAVLQNSRAIQFIEDEKIKQKCLKEVERRIHDAGEFTEKEHRLLKRFNKENSNEDAKRLFDRAFLFK